MNLRKIFVLLLGVMLIGIGIVGYAAQEFSDQKLKIITEFLEEKEEKLVTETVKNPLDWSSEPVTVDGTQVFHVVDISLEDENLSEGAIVARVIYEGVEFPFLIFLISLPEELSENPVSAVFNQMGKAYAINPVTEETGEEVGELKVELAAPDNEEDVLLLTLKQGMRILKLEIPKSAPPQK